MEPINQGKSMLLLKCLYGLKKSPTQWNIYIDSILKDMGFIGMKYNFGIYMEGEGKEAVFIALYVDDLFLVGKVLERIKEAKRGLNAEFKMKDLGEARFLLGIEIRRQPNGDVFLVRERYTIDVLSRYNMQHSKAVSTPLELGKHLSTDQEPATDAEKEEMTRVPYRSAIGGLMSWVTCTRPDLAAFVGELSKFSHLKARAEGGGAALRGGQKGHALFEGDSWRGATLQAGGTGGSVGLC